MNFLVGITCKTYNQHNVLIHIIKNDKSWNQWLAGLIDGDGCLLISKLGYTSCEITIDLKDAQDVNKFYLITIVSSKHILSWEQ